MTKKYNGIDITKFIMAICVVAIHTQPLISCNNTIILALYQSIVSLAVPFFFVASGFFLGKKIDFTNNNNTNKSAICSYIKRMTRLYLLWSLIYLPLAVAYYIKSEYSLVHSTFAYIRGLFFTGEHYNSWMLWYLLSTIYALIFIYLLVKKNVSLHITVIICGLITVAGLIITDLTTFSDNLPSFLNLFTKLIDKTIGNGRIFTGFFYISLGMLFSHKELSCKKSILLLVIGFTGTCISKNAISGIFLMLCVIGLFSLVVKWNGGNNKVCSKLRTISTVIYFTHMYIWTFYYTLIYHTKTYGVDSFVVTTIVAVLAGYIYLRFINYKKSRLVSKSTE